MKKIVCFSLVLAAGLSFAVLNVSGEPGKNEFAKGKSLTLNSAPDDDPEEAMWPPNHKFWKVTIVPPEGREIEDVIVYGSEDDEDDPNVNGDGNHTPDALPFGPVGDSGNWQGHLRAERAGDGVGRVYLVVVQLVDDEDEDTEDQDSIAVYVPHDMSEASRAFAAELADMAEDVADDRAVGVPPGMPGSITPFLIGNGPDTLP